LPEDIRDDLAFDVGDVDKDGDEDILMGYVPSSKPSLWLNDGAANFLDYSASRLPNVTCDTREVKLVDLNADGDLDVLMSCHQDQGLRQLVNDGTGTFKDVTAVNFQSGTNGDQRSRIALGYLDGDADIDLMSPSTYYGYMRTYLNGGDALSNDGAYFILRNDLFPPTPEKSAVMAVLSDLNKDTRTDIYLVANGQNQLYHQGTNGLFSNVTNTHLPAASDDTRWAVAEDLDLDGDQDLFVVNNGGIRLHIGEIDYKFADVSGSNVPSVPFDMQWADMADIDNDGFQDFVMAVWNGKNALVLNQGGAIFKDFTADMPNSNDYGRYIRFVDLDGDGRLDLFVATNHLNRIYLNKTP
jgi:hypothetical protein